MTIVLSPRFQHKLWQKAGGGILVSIFQTPEMLSLLFRSISFEFFLGCSLLFCLFSLHHHLSILPTWRTTTTSSTWLLHLLVDPGLMAVQHVNSPWVLSVL